MLLYPFELNIYHILVKITLRALCVGYYTHREKKGYVKKQKKIGGGIRTLVYLNSTP